MNDVPISCHIEQIYDVPLLENSAIATLVYTVGNSPHEDQTWVDALITQGDYEQHISFSREELRVLLPYFPHICKFMGLLDEARQAFTCPLVDT